MMLIVESTTLTQVRLMQFRRDSMQKGKRAVRALPKSPPSAGRVAIYPNVPKESKRRVKVRLSVPWRKNVKTVTK